MYVQTALEKFSMEENIQPLFVKYHELNDIDHEKIALPNQYHINKKKDDIIKELVIQATNYKKVTPTIRLGLIEYIVKNY